MALVRRLALAAFALVVGGCHGEPTAPAAPSPAEVAAALDGLAQAAFGDGDLKMGSALGNAAAAVRGGMVPSRITIIVGDTRVPYSAFVHRAVIEEGTPPRQDVLMQTLVAWRDIEKGRGSVLSVDLLGDESGRIFDPRSAEPGIPVIPAARATLVDHAAKVRWEAISGSVTITEKSVGKSCDRPAAGVNPVPVRCVEASFAVQFGLSFAAVGPGGVPDLRRMLLASAAVQPVAGTKLVLGPPIGG